MSERARWIVSKSETTGPRGGIRPLWEIAEWDERYQQYVVGAYPPFLRRRDAIAYLHDRGRMAGGRRRVSRPPGTSRSRDSGPVGTGPSSGAARRSAAPSRARWEELVGCRACEDDDPCDLHPWSEQGP